MSTIPGLPDFGAFAPSAWCWYCDARRRRHPPPLQSDGGEVTTYEWGRPGAGVQTYVRYYIFGLLFVLFDVEAVFIFPWALVAEELGVFGLVAVLLFMLTLIEGLFYAIKKGVLRWE